ncbi:hypothetical protein DSAG12_02755 [Promethearchaeum syntrophicum]|uniref:Uncharacterized protein n=1 Tax=Promethearchaeum syntrophicum TaxID=2594042 RepID=A0A5B9DD56_9ARCH|nr:hypothetical protein [Candidatus Prometheoarchaeum syntrophicum]QEE16925.1 hypothetical protein DSAG12_02755 [Candidatus Prometheoarchaeum syntrophicum]
MNEVNHPYIRHIPTYTQHVNGCGLSSLLMLVDLPKNIEISEFLDKIWDKISGIFGKTSFNQKDLKLAVALQYLLLKSVGISNKDALYKFFNERLEYLYEDHKIINKYNQEQFRQNLLNKHQIDEAYTFLHYLEGDHDYITPLILMTNIHTMKTDAELKIIAEIFNYEFLYQDSEDQTGAFYFSKQDLVKKIPETTKEKWKKLEEFSNNPEVIILYGQFHHWLAIRGIYRIHQLTHLKKTQDIENLDNIEESDEKIESYEWNRKSMIIDMNDPATSTTVQLNFSQLSEGDRFYILKKRPNTDFKIFKNFLKYIEKDIKEEEKRWKNFLKKKVKEKPKQKEPTIDLTDEEASIAAKYESKIKEILDGSINSNQEQKYRIIKLKEPPNVNEAPKEKSEDNEDYPKFWDMMDDE